jgi:hypothetical protein
MRHTLKAVFEHRSDAQQVLDELLASGYPRADIALSDIATTGPADDEGHATGLGASIRHAAARLLGTLHHKDAETHRHIVTLTTESDPAAARAAGIIGNHHPAGLEDIHDERDPGDRRADVAGAGTGSATMRRRYPPGTAPGSLQHRPHEDSHYFGTQNASAPPAGMTYQETLGSIAQWSTPDEEEEIAPLPLDTAPDLARDEGVRAADSSTGQAWEEVEPVLKSDWESRHAGSTAAAWDKVKTALRHGWERARH